MGRLGQLTKSESQSNMSSPRALQPVPVNSGALLDTAKLERRKEQNRAKSRKHALKKKAEKAIATAKIAELQALRFLDGLLGAERDRQLTEANQSAITASTPLNEATATIAQLQKEVGPIFSVSRMLIFTDRCCLSCPCRIRGLPS